MTATPYAAKRTSGHPVGTHCQRCGKKISEKADVQAGEVRIRCRNCNGVNVITRNGHRVED